MENERKSFDEMKGQRWFPINYDLSSNAHHLNVQLGNPSNLTVFYDSSSFSETEPNTESENEDLGFSHEFFIDQKMQPFESKEPIFTSNESLDDSPETHNLSDVQHIEEMYIDCENLQNDINVELSPNLPFSTDIPGNQCLYCQYCPNRLDDKFFIIHTDVSNYVCPECNMEFSRQLLMRENMQAFESREPSFTPEESFSNVPDSTETHHFSDVELMKEIYAESEDLQNDIDLDNSIRNVDQIDQINSIDFIEIDDDDDDIERIDVDANESLNYSRVLHCNSDDVDDNTERIDVDANESLNYSRVLQCNSNDKDAAPNVCIEESQFPDKDNGRDPPMAESLNETSSNSGPSTSLDQSNSSSKRGRWVKLVSDFDDFAERPFACALCYQRYSEFKQLSVHVRNHLTGAGSYDGGQTMTYFPF